MNVSVETWVHKPANASKEGWRSYREEISSVKPNVISGHATSGKKQISCKLRLYLQDLKPRGEVPAHSQRVSSLDYFLYKSLAASGEMHRCVGDIFNEGY